MDVTLSAEGRARLDKHLDAVEAALARAGNSRERRRAVVDDLEAQIQEMLAARSATPTLEDVEAVLGKVDPPAAYHETVGAAVGAAPPVASAGAPGPAGPSAVPAAVMPVRPRYSRTAIWGLVCILISLLPLALTGVFVAMHQGPRGSEVLNAQFMSDLEAGHFESVVLRDQGKMYFLTGYQRSQPGVVARQVVTRMPGTDLDGGGYNHLKELCAKAGTHFDTAPSTLVFAPMIGLLTCMTPLGLLATILGWVAFFQIRQSKGRLRGKGLALFDGLFCPVAGVVFLIAALLVVR